MLAGRRLGDFVVREQIGEGAHGVVHRAEQPVLQREAVIKALRARRDGAEARARFLREARLASRLEHPAAAHIYAFGAEDDGLHWIAMELVRGTPLARFLEEQGPLPTERLVPLLDQICDVVQAAHDQGIVHRDLKPANIMVTARGERLEAKLLDFGLARLALEGDEGDRGQVGTPSYMAPELWGKQARGDARSDQYALGILAYECAAGAPPFTGTLVEVGRAHQQRPLPELASPLREAIARACAKRPEERHPSVAAFAAELRAAAGLEIEPAPPLPEALRRAMLELPQPIAESIAGIEAARSLHQAAGAARAALETFARFAGAIALCARTRGQPVTTAAPDLLYELPRRVLEPEEWLELARRIAPAEPFPELPAALAEPIALDIDAGISDERVRARHGVLIDALVKLCGAFGFLARTPLVVARDGVAELWTGPRRVTRAVAPARSLPDGRPALLDAGGRPALLLWPLAQVAPPSPGAPDELFLFVGPGRHGARLVAAPLGFERQDPTVWEWLRGALDVEADETAGGDGGAPWRGLASYTSDDAAAFFGREEQTQAAVNRLRTQALLVVVGPSGSGKSSFVQAGVLPALGRRAVVLRPGPAPLATLAARLGDSEPGVLVVDQLEELFTLGAPPAERERFAERLVELARDPARVILTVRDDFLARADALPALRDRLAQAVQLLGTPAPAELHRILVEPARRAGYGFDDPELPARMVAEVAGAPGALALLSFTASRLWERRDRHFKRLTREAYEAIGGVGGALAQHAEAVLAELPGAQRRRVRELFRHLVTAEGTRAVIGREALREIAGGEALIERLVAARLLTATDEGTIEIAHEALLSAWPRLAEWRREDVAGARMLDELRAAAQAWQARGQPRGLLWRDDALADYRRWRADFGGALPSGEEAFAAASLREAKRGRRTRALLVGGALAVLSVASIFLFTLSRRAENALTDSYAEQGRQYLLGGDTLRGLVYLEEALARGGDTPGVRWLIGRGLTELSAQAAVYPHEASVTEVALRGEVLATRTVDRKVTIWRGGRRQLLATEEKLTEIALSPDGETLLALGGGAAFLWRTVDGTQIARLEGADRAVFSADGQTVATAGHGAIRRWTRDGAMTGSDPFDGRAVGLGFTGDGRVAAVSHRGRITAGDTSFGDDGDVTAARLSGDVAAIARGSQVELWGLDGRRRAVLEHAGAVSVIALGAGGMLAATSGPADAARVWDAASGRLLSTLPGDGSLVARLVICFGDQVLTTRSDGGVRLHGATSGRLHASLAGHRRFVFAADCDGESRVATGSFDGTARVWDARRAPIVRRARVASVGVKALAADGATLAVAGADDRVTIGDRPPFATCDVSRVRLRGGRLAVACLKEQEARVYDAESGALLQRLPHPAEVYDVAFGPDGARLATASYDGHGRIFDGEKLVATLRGHDDRVLGIDISPDGARLVTAGRDRTARVWAADGTPLATLAGHESFLQSAAFDASGERVITASSDRTVRVWRLDGTVVSVLSGHNRDVTAALALPGGELVASLAADGALAVHEIASGKLLQLTKAHLGIAEAAVVVGDTLVTAGTEQPEILWWDMRPYAGTAAALHAELPCRLPFELTGGRLVERQVDHAACGALTTWRGN